MKQYGSTYTLAACMFVCLHSSVSRIESIFATQQLGENKQRSTRFEPLLSYPQPACNSPQFARLQTHSPINQSWILCFLIIRSIICNDPKGVVVEYHKTQDIQETICINIRVPLIRHVADSRVGESCMPTDSECQIMAITISVFMKRA